MAHSVHVSFTSTPNNSDHIYGATGTDELMAQTFAPTADIACSKVKLVLAKTGSPADNLTVRIETTSSGNPTGTLVDANATKTMAAGDIASYVNPANNTYEFEFPDTFTLSNGTTYAIVAQRSGARDTSNRIDWLINTTGGYAGGEYKSRNSGTWASGSEGGDAWFEVYEFTDDFVPKVIIL